MSMSIEWDELYRADTHMSIWPWSDLVSYIMRYARPEGDPSRCRVLEIGCGAGANIPFFKWLGVDYHSVEGSLSIVDALLEKYPEYTGKIKVGDFTSEIPFDGDFDIVIDRASLTHNNTTSIKHCLSLLLEKMKPGAAFFGIDWFSVNHTDFKKGISDEDGYTKYNITDGQFAGTGKVHFSDQEHLQALFSGFEMRILEEKKVLRVIPNDDHVFSSWNFHAVRR